MKSMSVRVFLVFLALLGCCHATQAQAEWTNVILLAEAEDDEDDDDDEDSGGGSGYVHSYSAPSYSSYSASPRHYSRARRAPRAHHAKRYSRSHKAKPAAHRVSRHASAKSHHGRAHGVKYTRSRPAHGFKHHSARTSHRKPSPKTFHSAKPRSKSHGTVSRYHAGAKGRRPVRKAGVESRTRAGYQPKPRLEHHSVASASKPHAKTAIRRKSVANHNDRLRTSAKQRPDHRERRLHPAAGKKTLVSRGSRPKKPVTGVRAAPHGKTRKVPTPSVHRQKSTGKSLASAPSRPTGGKPRQLHTATGKTGTKPERPSISGKSQAHPVPASKTKPVTGLKPAKALSGKPGSRSEAPSVKRGAESKKSGEIRSANTAKQVSVVTKPGKNESRVSGKSTGRQTSGKTAKSLGHKADTVRRAGSRTPQKRG